MESGTAAMSTAVVAPAVELAGVITVPLASRSANSWRNAKSLATPCVVTPVMLALTPPVIVALIASLERRNPPSTAVLVAAPGKVPG